MQHPVLENGQTEVKRGRGRPAIITLPLVQQVGQLIAKGMTEEQACLRVGINYCSFRTARSRNPEFESAVKEAQANYIDESIDVIEKGGRGWQGRAWLLERRHGEQFRRNSGLEVLAHVAPIRAADLLARKPLAQWSTLDLEQSVGAWKLLKSWPPEQLNQLLDLYHRHWGPFNEWDDERLGWAADIERRLGQVRTEETEALPCEVVSNGEVHTMILA